MSLSVSPSPSHVIRQCNVRVARLACAFTLTFVAASTSQAQAQAQSPNAASAAGALPDTSQITKEMIDRGRKIYHEKGQCSVCHGMQMEGTPVAPPHRKASGWKDAKNGEFAELVRVISTGVQGTLMVPFPNGISRDEAILVASYIWGVNHRSASP